MLCSSVLYAQGPVARGGYGDLMYPYVHQYDQMLTYKIGVDYCPESETAPLDANQVLEIIKKIDGITRHIPKMVYLVGWQYRGHDTGYPSFTQVNEALKRPEDSTALSSLRWLMKQGPGYNTRVSLHVNFSDVYLDDNPLGPVYKEKDIIVRWSNGAYHEGYRWCDHMAYRASNYRNWNQGTFREEQINPLMDMIPELAGSGSLHPDAWYNTSDPYYRISDEQDCRAMREMTAWVREKYQVDITTEFDRRRPENVDFVLFHPMLWHIAWDERTPPDPMKIPAYIQTGANAKTWSGGNETTQSMFFGEMGDYEGKILSDPNHLAGIQREFATRTLPWYFLNRKLRVSFDGNTARFTDDLKTLYPGKYTILQGDDLLQDGGDVFIPALWLPHREIIAYSSEGYGKREWKMPTCWKGVDRVDMYRVDFGGIVPVKRNVRIDGDRMITLSLAADEQLSIVPAGIDPVTIMPATAGGSVTFLGTDTLTNGRWKGIYGREGFMIVGDATRLPQNVEVGLINGADKIWSVRTQDMEALDRATEQGKVAATRSHSLHESIDLDIYNGKEQAVALYLLDWERQGRWTLVDVIDPSSGKIMDSRSVTRFGSGIYLKYKVKGKVQIRLTNVYSDRYPGSPDTGFSAIFFGFR